MLLKDLKTLLEIPATDNSKDAKLQIELDAAISEVQGYCNQTFMDPDGNIDLPGSVKIAVKILVQGMGTNEAIQSDSIAGGMSKTYRAGGYKAAAKQYLKPFRKIKVIEYEESGHYGC